MRKIITTTFVTLDGVMQAPGGPEEDTSSGFAYGGWQMGKYDDEISGKVMQQIFTSPFELLLGHTTYTIFAAYWPHHSEIDLVAGPFNNTKKYVVAHESFPLSWDNSELVTGDVVSTIKKLKEMDGPDLWVWGSGNLIQTLLKHNLIDRMHIWTHPVTVGTGKKLFADGTLPQKFEMIDSKITTTGVIIATYEPSESLKI